MTSFYRASPPSIPNRGGHFLLLSLPCHCLEWRAAVANDGFARLGGSCGRRWIVFTISLNLTPDLESLQGCQQYTEQCGKETDRVLAGLHFSGRGNIPQSWTLAGVASVSHGQDNVSFLRFSSL